MSVEWNKISGEIDFISESYITICVSQTERTDDDYALRKSNRCCVLCFPEDWDDVVILGNK